MISLPLTAVIVVADIFLQDIQVLLISRYQKINQLKRPSEPIMKPLPANLP
jgi:hypothetical protein